MTGASEASTPRVSLIILAFNQERFVDAAIAAATAQDYPNLEIIFSDDNSSDGTFALIEEAVAAYSGPHRLMANRTRRNAGILAHVYDAVGKSSGDLIVLGAADDISYPHRVSTLMREWQRGKWMALSSASDVIDDAGKVIGAGSPAREAESRDWLVGPEPVPAIGGATGAYDRRVFDALALPDFPILAEDFFFATMLAMRRQPVGYVDEPLVGYRVHDASLTHRTAATDLEDHERRTMRYAAQVNDLIAYFARAGSTGEGISPDFGTARALDLATLQRDLAHNRLRAEWMDAPGWRRLTGLAKVRTRDQFRWLAPRAFGLAGLSAIRKVRSILGSGSAARA